MQLSNTPTTLPWKHLKLSANLNNVTDKRHLASLYWDVQRGRCRIFVADDVWALERIRRDEARVQCRCVPADDWWMRMLIVHLNHEAWVPNARDRGASEVTMAEHGWQRSRKGSEILCA